MYLDLVIKESLRMYPPAPIIWRETKENTKIGIKDNNPYQTFL